MLKLLEALLNWSGYRVDYIHKHRKGRYCNIHFRYKARRFSPVFWLFCIFTFPFNWFKYGFKDTIQSINDQFEYRPSKWLEFYHPKGSNKLTKAVRNFVKVYSYSNV